MVPWSALAELSGVGVSVAGALSLWSSYAKALSGGWWCIALPRPRQRTYSLVSAMI